MDQIETAIILLTILVTVLTLVLIALIVVVVVVLGKINKIANDASRISENLSAATAWLSPATVFSAAVRAFRRD